MNIVDPKNDIALSALQVDRPQVFEMLGYILERASDRYLSFLGSMELYEIGESFSDAVRRHLREYFLRMPVVNEELFARALRGDPEIAAWQTHKAFRDSVRNDRIFRPMHMARRVADGDFAYFRLRVALGLHLPRNLAASAAQHGNLPFLMWCAEQGLSMRGAVDQAIFNNHPECMRYAWEHAHMVDAETFHHMEERVRRYQFDPDILAFLEEHRPADLRDQLVQRGVVYDL